MHCVLVSRMVALQYDLGAKNVYQTNQHISGLYGCLPRYAVLARYMLSVRHTPVLYQNG